LKKHVTNVRARKKQEKKQKHYKHKKGTEWKTNSVTKNTTNTHTGILIQNFYDSGYNYNEVSQKNDPWDNVSHCNSWQMATKGALKMQEWKMREHIAGVENAGADCRGGKCRSGKYRSDKVWKAIRRRKYSKVRDEISASMPAFVGESEFRIIICLHFLDIYSI